jgi:c-di-GMP-binding flagellar brake protein YcgR
MKGPKRGSIEVPDVGSLPALVELEAGHATAILLVRTLHALDDVVGRKVAIDVATSRGLLHYEARVAGVRDGDVLDLEVAAPRELIQRREFARVDALLQVTVASGIAASAVNISGSGVVLSARDGLAPDAAIDLTLWLAPHEPPIAISGRVIRQVGEDTRHWAVHFEHVHEADRERIVRFVFERQRVELQRSKRA